MSDIALLQPQWGTAAPTDTAIFHQAGEIVFQQSPVAGAPMGWICSVEGWPGTWIPLPPLGSTGLTTIAAGGTLSAYVPFLSVQDAGALVLAATSLFPAGFPVRIRANAASLTITATGGQIDGAAAKTLAANAAATLMPTGTVWYSF